MSEWDRNLVAVSGRCVFFLDESKRMTLQLQFVTYIRTFLVIVTCLFHIKRFFPSWSMSLDISLYGTFFRFWYVWTRCNSIVLFRFIYSENDSTIRCSSNLTSDSQLLYEVFKKTVLFFLQIHLKKTWSVTEIVLLARMTRFDSCPIVNITFY